jgi:hypothetical protein
MPRSTISVTASAALLRDNVNVSRHDDANLSLQFSHAIPLVPRLPQSRQLQLTFRYVRQSASRLERLLGIDTRRRVWTLNSGLSINVF